MTRQRTFVAFGVAAIALALLPGAASASAADPAVGECFALSDAQSYEDYWPTSAPVPCSGPHSIEIERRGALPADVDAFAFAAEQCDVAGAWAHLGVNQPVKGVVRNPLRLEVFPFAIRNGSLPAWVCGVGPVEFRGAKGTVLISMSGAVENLTLGQRRWLRYCNSAARGRSAFVAPISVPCSTVPRWQVEKWIMWSEIYSTYPGQAVIKAQAARLCAPATTFSYPTAADWPDGSRRSFCYMRHM